MLHKYRYGFSIVVGKKFKLVESVDKICAQFNVRST